MAIIAKPVDRFGGQGVFKVCQDDTNASAIFEMLSDSEAKRVILQRCIPQASVGDKRIILLNGAPLGVMLRVHPDHDHRNNMAVGGTVEKATLTARDKEIINTIAPHLGRLGIHFSGIDVIGDYLIEVNVTSPTGIQEMNRLYGVSLENDVIQAIETMGAGLS